MNEKNTASLRMFLSLIQRSQSTNSAEELAFLLVNDTHLLLPFRQSVFWLVDSGVHTLSGVVQVEANAPYVHWLNKVCAECSLKGASSHLVVPESLSKGLADEWGEWLPHAAFWVPLRSRDGVVFGAFMIASDEPWSQEQLELLDRWGTSWSYAWSAITQPQLSTWSKCRKTMKSLLRPEVNQAVWKQRRTWIFVCLIACLFFPVRLSILAQGELVPSDPLIVRSPLDGVVRQFFIRPNDIVKVGQPLFDFEDATLLTRREVAKQGLETSEAEYRQQVQQALSDLKAKAQLATLFGRIEERKSEFSYVENLVNRSQVLASKDGIAIFDDANDWVGKPVQTGERIMRIADPAKLEIEAWVAVGDAVPMEMGAPVSFYLSASPFKSMDGRLRYISHEASLRPDGSYAYRVRARLESGTAQRVGLKGTARLYGERVPFIYWMLRRPLAVIRQVLGW